MTKSALEVIDLHKSFPVGFWSVPKKVLKGVQFSVPEGSLTGFLGANGSGKTTTFKCLFNLIKKDQGEIKVFGKTDLSPETKSSMGFLPEHPRFCEDLTAEELLLFFGTLTHPSHSISLKERVHKLLKEFNMYEYRNGKLGTFSKGMIQKVGIIQALVSEPALLILDEPFAGLDPESRQTVMSWIEKIHREKGVTVCFSSHIFQDIERVCDRLIIIKEGQLVFEGNFVDFQKEKSGRQNILYLLKDQKHSLLVSSQEECQKELKRLLSEGAVILSLQSEGGDLEQRYKSLMKEGKS